MDPSVYAKWNTIDKEQLSSNGDWVSYNIVPGYGDKTLVLYNTRTQQEIRFPRGEKAKFDYSNSFLAFEIIPHLDSLQDHKRRKGKPQEAPKDSLGVYHLGNGTLEKFANLKKVAMADKMGGVIAFKIGTEQKVEEDTIQSDTIVTDTIIKPIIKKRPKKKTDLVIYYDVLNKKMDTLKNVESFVFPKYGTRLFTTIEKEDSITNPGVYYFERGGNDLKSIFRTKGKFSNLTPDSIGIQCSFIADLDTTEAQIRPYELYYWNNGQNGISQIIYPGSAVIPENYLVSDKYKLEFSDSGKRLYFGIAPSPDEIDTTLIADELVDVEIWNYKDGKMYTQQEVEESRTRNKTYVVVYHTKQGRTITLGAEGIPSVSFAEEETSYALGYSNLRYTQRITWNGYAENDLYRMNVNTGEYRTIGSEVSGRPRVSPGGSYFYWYDSPDTSWYAYSVVADSTLQITSNDVSTFYDELNDRPRHPGSYSIAGWTTDDARVIVYDRYDLWEIDPSNVAAPRRITQGRENNLEYRLVRLDREEKYINANERVLLNFFNNKDKSSGYAYCDLTTGEITPIMQGDYLVRRDVIKAEKSDDILFKRQSFEEFPDLIHSNTAFENQEKISNANPQQQDYDWGTIEVYSWKDRDGIMREGLLVKPAGFSDSTQYPLMVNFYEKNSNNLHRHRAPFAHRSTITYAYYANQGYVIFNPDIYYKVGYPGQSCVDAVTSGVEALVEEGFVDTSRMGVQGHSWGGYQIAYMLNKTNMFKCAEAGAPVVNMVSAYGGIRWRSGMSRMFQYEKTQSRLGATLWERPDLYLENSPIFEVDNTNTPVLILHNDGDGAVPWYQGIEYFTALRRLGKPAWMLNYRDEPHWPLKWQNRLDFNIRMQAFFDHYLMDKDIPKWMEEGSSPLEVISIRDWEKDYFDKR